MKICSECKGEMIEEIAKTPENINYKYYKCSKCGEEIVNMKQLHDVAEKYMTMKTYHVKLSKWGLSVGLRIPKELTKKYRLKDDEEVKIIPEDKGFRVLAT